MNERAYQVECDSDELTIRRKSDRHLLTVCFQGSFHENAMKSKLDVLKYVHDFVGQAIDDEEFSATVRGSLLRERDSMAETAELKKLVEAVSEVPQMEAKLMDDGEADDEEAVVKLRKAQKAIIEAAKMTVRNACRARGFDNEATDNVVRRVFLGGSSLWAAIEEEEQQQKRNNENVLVR